MPQIRFERIRRAGDTAGFRYLILTSYMSVLLFLSLNPWIRPVTRHGAFSPDKIDHAFAYGGLSLIIFLCLDKSRKWHEYRKASVWALAISIAMLIGIMIEIAQSLFTLNRTGSLADAAANSIGTVTGYAVYHVAKYLRT